MAGGRRRSAGTLPVVVALVVAAFSLILLGELTVLGNGEISSTFSLASLRAASRSSDDVRDWGVLRFGEASAAAWKRARQNEVLPPVVAAFRRGEIDWHDLLPSHSSIWSKFGDSQDPTFKFMTLVMKEAAVTDYLTHFSGSSYGREHGPLGEYAMCDVLQSPCLLHRESACAADSFCGWINGSCNEATHKQEKTCAIPYKLKNGRMVPAPLQECALFVEEDVFLADVSDDASRMFFHWWKAFSKFHTQVLKRKLDRDGFNGTFKALPGDLLQGEPLRTQFIVTEEHWNTQFYHYFGLLSSSCWRRASQVPNGTCFCSYEQPYQGYSPNKVLVNFLLQSLNLHNQPAPSRVRVGIISRRNKRFLLNEDELVSACLDLGVDVQLLPLEQMTLYEQLAAMREVTVLVGVHGSGLNNAVFMRPGTVLIQLLPFGLNYKGAFKQNADKADVVYRDWQLKDRNLSRFHWEFLGDDEKINEKLGGKKAVLDKGSGPQSAVVYTFWINQDIIVPVEEFKTLIREAIQASPFNEPIYTPPPGLLGKTVRSIVDLVATQPTSQRPGSSQRLRAAPWGSATQADR